MKAWKWLLAGSVVWVLGLVLALAVLMTRAVSAAPVVLAHPEMRDADALAWMSFRQRMAKGTLTGLLQGREVQVEMSQGEARSMLNSAVQKLVAAQTEVSMSPERVDVTATLFLAQSPMAALSRLGPWLNVRTQWVVNARSSQRPELASVQVGDLSVPPALAIWLMQQVAQRLDMADALFVASGLIQQAQVSQGSARVKLLLTDELKARGFAMFVPQEDWAALPQQRDVLVRALGRGGCSLAQVLPPMFELARQRSMAWSMTLPPEQAKARAARENRVVLLVAAMHAIKWPVQRSLPGADQWIDPNTPDLCLRGRVDFAQHYLLSAWMASQAGGRLTNALGQFKEVLDAMPGAGGSGYSFNDIAADLAGSRLGQQARLNPTRLQTQAATSHSEGDWMPEVADLPEFLSADQMDRTFGQPGSPAHERMWRLIQARVDGLAVLQ